MNDTPIFDAVKKIANSCSSRFCMPGHKGKSAFLEEAVNKFDITELTGTDNLYNPSGAIAKAAKSYADFIGAKDSFFIVNGSSGGVHAAVLSVLNPGDEVIAVRDFHLSAVHAFALAGAEPHFIYSGIADEGLFNPAAPNKIERAVKKHPRSKAVYLTYPDYWGTCADLPEICRIAHNAGMKVICDAAHAAAFDYSNKLPLSPAEAGCDIWTLSLHKTLPAMNQCGALCVGNKSGIERSLVQSRLNLLQTTSPSYILLASSEYALAYMKNYGEKQLDEAVERVEYHKKKIDELRGYKCLPYEPKNKNDFDLLKLAVDVSGRGLSGFSAAHMLEEAGIFVEAADLKRILLICTISDEEIDFKKLTDALNNIKGSANKETDVINIDKIKIDGIFNTQLAMNIRNAVFATREAVFLKLAAGRISAVCAGAYPPGVPVILPGEIITEEMIVYLTGLKKTGYSLFGCGDTIDVVKE